MKKISTFCLALCLTIWCLAFVQCKKSSPSQKSANIVGNWKWLYTYYDQPLGSTNPETPANTGIDETIIFNYDYTYYTMQNDVKVDSGTYSTGHGSYIGASTYAYDSVCYYSVKTTINTYDFYEVHKDTLIFSSGFAGYAGGTSKYWVRQ